ncbi:hypothetical protein Goshw_023543, partial [Gossypium schwendimanii]|nr:hypothetical protein [Gossypium schwendimanii]
FLVVFSLALVFSIQSVIGQEEKAFDEAASPEVDRVLLRSRIESRSSYWIFRRVKEENAIVMLKKQHETQTLSRRMLTLKMRRISQGMM